jgi:hypothetical protein
MMFGTYSTSKGEIFKGKLLTGRIYNRVLTAAEVTNNYNGTVTTSGLVAQYLMTDGAGATVTDSIGTANGTVAGTPRWNDVKKVITCQVTYTDTDTNQDIVTQGSVEFELVKSGQKGPQGAAAPIGYLTNDTAVVTTDNTGSGGTYGAPNTQSTLTIFSGAADVTNQYTISQARNSVTVTEATNSNVATVTNMTADTGSVVFTATRTGYPTITKTFSLAKSKMGVVGQTPTSYWLNLSAGTITVADDGSYTPSSITISAESQAGTAQTVTYSGRFIIAESTDGSTFTNMYTSAADESSHTYTPSSGLKAIKVTLYQAGGTSNKLDEQNVMLVGNGKNSVMLSAWTPTGNVIHNAANTVTAEADLYNGGSLVTGTNYRWVKGNGAATSVIAGSGYEDLDLGRRNFVPNSAFINGFTGWSNNTGNYKIDSSTYNSNPVVTCNNTTTFNASSGYYDLTQPVYNLKPSTQYTFSMWVKGTGQRFEMYLVEFKEATSNTTTTTTYQDHGTIATLNGTTYTLLTTTFTTQSDCGSGKIYIRTFGQTQVWFTEVKMEQGEAATPWIAAYEDNNIDPTADTTLYGQNLLRNTTNFANLNYWSLSMGSGQTGLLEIVTDATKGQVLHASKTNNVSWWVVQNASYNYYPIFDTTKKYSISFDIKSANSTNFGVAIMNANGTNAVMNNVGITTSTSWVRKYITFTPLISGSGQTPELYLTGNIDDYYITNIKMEQLPYATDYTPAPVDGSLPNLAAGVNKWIFRYYNDGNSSVRKAYGYSDLPSLTPVYQTLLTDQANIQTNLAEYYVGYYKTAVYVSTAKTVNFTTNIDDTITVFVNGLQQYANTATSGNTTIPLSLQAGWNSVEIINQEITGADGIWGTPILSTLVEEMNCNYAIDYGSLKGNYGIMGYNTSSMIVNTNAVNDTDQFMCVATYRGTTYKDTVTIDDVTDPITIIINGARLFKNGQGTNTYTAQLFQSGTEIDSAGTAYTYTWYVYNSDGSIDSAFGGSGSKTGKTITLASSDINTRGRLQCVVSQ